MRPIFRDGFWYTLQAVRKRKGLGAVRLWGPVTDWTDWTR